MKVLTSLRQVMLKIYKLMEKTRRIFASVMLPTIMLYEAPIWIPAMDEKCHKKKLLLVQVALMIISVYKVISIKALLVLARTLVSKHQVLSIKNGSSKETLTRSEGHRIKVS